MGAQAVASRIDRKSSMETEPRTLNMQQIEFAREAALYVVNTRSLEEAFKIFTEGLEPVAKMEEQDVCGAMPITEDRNEQEEEDDNHEYYYWSSKRNQDQFGVGQFRDVLTAPF